MSYREQVMKGDIHNMMIDPSTVNARIYVGNIPTNDITKQDVEDRFKKYGPILGISLNRKFGFVQYERESSAVEAIKLENGSLFRGKKIEVNAARVYGKRNRLNDGPGPRRSDSADRGGDSYRDRSPLDDRAAPPRDRGDWRDRDRFDNYGNKATDRDIGYYGGRDTGFGKDGPFPSSDKFPGGPPRDERIGGFGKDQPPFGSTPFRSSIPESRGVGPKEMRPVSNVPPMDRTNDCEIIVCNKKQREYAEYIEHWLKGIGLTVDLLFPNEEVPISRVLANIASRGTLYAIVVMPQNEEHRSLTLNILHGLPQEHRNMPLEDAVPMIERDFKAYMRGEKVAGPPGAPAVPTGPAGTAPSVPAPISVVPAAPAVGMSLSDRHPEAIQVLLNLLADNRQLTVLQYDRVIRYLQDKRELQLKLELGDAKDIPPVKDASSKQQVDLQHRILNILNNTNNSTAGSIGGSTLAPVPPPTPVSAPAPSSWPVGSQASAPTPLLNDPTVQKALDSLMQGNLLRKIAPSTVAASSPIPPTSSTLSTPSGQPLFGAFASVGRRF